MARRAIVIACLIAMCAAIAPAHAQSGFDRPGGDFASFPVPSGDPATCAVPVPAGRTVFTGPLALVTVIVTVVPGRNPQTVMVVLPGRLMLVLWFPVDGG